MKKVFQKHFAKVLAAMLSVSLLVSCGGGTTPETDDDNKTDPGKTEDLASDETEDKAGNGIEYTPIGEYPIANETINMTMFSMSAPNIVDWETNDFTLYMEEKTNVKWDFVQAPADGTREMITLLLSSDD